jgi:hypothetical protein
MEMPGTDVIEKPFCCVELLRGEMQRRITERGNASEAKKL